MLKEKIMTENPTYEQDLLIDKYKLDDEWLTQPGKFMHYCTLQAGAESTMREAKDKLELVKAQLYQEISGNPDKYSLSKTTETSINGALIQTAEYKRTLDEYNEAVYEHNVLIGAVRAFDQRKTALENLVRLYGQQYFSAPVSNSEQHRETIHTMERGQSAQSIKDRRSKRK
jgi:hypothetical protein